VLTGLRKARHQKRERNFWKTAFFVLLLLILAAVLFLTIALTGGSSEKEIQQDNLDDKSRSEAIFTVQANRQQLESLINNQIRSAENDRLTYHVTIGKHLVLKGHFRLLFTGIPFSLTFDPKVSHGDIILKEADVKIGSLNLPDKEVLSFLKAGTDFPEWVVINPNHREIYINLTQVKIQDGLYLRAETINLPDEVSFTVHQQDKGK
jgi:uncharacterized protein YpmS